MEVLKALVILALMVMISPTFATSLKSTLLIEAVTQIFPACVCAQTTAAISIHSTRRPPCNKPMGLVSLGQTTSVLIVSDAAGVLFIISQNDYFFICLLYTSDAADDL